MVSFAVFAANVCPYAELIFTVTEVRWIFHELFSAQ